MHHIVKYNSQRDNFSFAGTFPGWKQCFSTCAYMMMTYYWGVSGSDHDLAAYVDDVEAGVGKKGIAETIKRAWMGRFTSYWMVVQQAGINKWMRGKGLHGETIWGNGHWFELDEVLKDGPVILHTNKIGGLKGGHLVLVIGMDDEYYYLHDPYGVPWTNYVDTNGESVPVRKTYLKKYTDKKPLFMYWKGE